MVFSSISFIYYFLPCVIILYYIIPKKFSNLILLISSICFYVYGEPVYIFLMISTTLVVYFCSLFIDRYRDKKIKKLIYILGLSIPIGSLFVFKYLDFITVNINTLFQTKLQVLELALPIGISFYTFQLLSYIIDVYKGNVKVQKSFIKLATYVSLFPQLIAGPIVRYQTIEEELDNREHSLENFAYGVTRFVIGLAKKVLIANSLGQFCNIFLTINEKSVIFYWIYGISYSLQIYYDFSAYSDMAIGLGRIFGFHFLENFNYPYISKSITEFWRRWHISLGSWFKDYVYIPLGGNRKGKFILLRNIFIVWLLTGIWHGANWTFITWGLMFGGLLTIEKFLIKDKLDKVPNVFRRIYVLFFIMISFIIFNSPDMNTAINHIIGLFGVNGEKLINGETIYYLRSYFIIIVAAIIGSTPLINMCVKKIKEHKNIKKIKNVMEPIFIIAMLIIVTGYLVDNSFNPFLYFRF